MSASTVAKSNACTKPLIIRCASLSDRTDEIETLMMKGYSIDEAREVALPLFILLRPEGGPNAGLSQEQIEELAEMEREYRKNPPVQT